ncbi:MAG: carbamoyltransferase [Candidatus Lokiarchaeota archaeon]|nr:carbamoyltransferase [Candidatus Lokiarchaeota archaeon]
MYILGIACHYHDSSACLIKDERIIAAAEEERFTRKKHDNSYPINAINFCLEYAKIKSKDLRYICFYEKPLLKIKRIIIQHLQKAPFSYESFSSFFTSWMNHKLWIKSKIRKSLNYKGKIYFIEHHQAHAASSFFPSPFKEAAFLTVDGVGEWATTTYGIGKENKIQFLKEINFPHSLGLLYSTITAYLGFTVNNSEYKVMGLSPYGNMDKKTNLYYHKLKKIIDLKKDGSFRLNMDYFDYHYRMKMPSKKMCKLLGSPISERNCEMTQRHKDIAAALQMIYEEVLFKMLNHLYEETKLHNLVIAGGCGLNSVANGKILKNTSFKNIYIQPAAGDGGNSIGAALFCYNHILGNKKREVQDTAYLGPDYKDRYIQKFLDNNSIKYTKFKNKNKLVKITAKLIYDNNVIGWFQGRMEWGPRALGNRSILANPCNPKAQDLLNEKVKHREKFRPFAPVVCEEDTLKYFECDKSIPLPTDFMLMVYPIRKEWHKKIPSVTHVDGSGRLQTIRRFQNKDYYDLIKEFGKLSGIPILINTSFNIRGEPIVCTPKEAYLCMMGTGIDYLVIGNFLIKRDDNLKDMWDCEALAND